MDFDDFIDVLRTLLFGSIVALFAVILIIVAYLGIQQCRFSINKSIDTSVGKVYCDKDNVYTGRLYRVGFELVTDNLQAPQYYIKIMSKNWHMKKEAEYFCKDFVVTKVSD